MTFDIRTIENARKTLTSLTGVSLDIWNENLYRTKDYKYDDYFVKDIINTYGKMPSSYKDFEFVYLHVTTSANECETFKKYGILDLKNSYNCKDTELRVFLDENGVYIDIENCTLTYKGQIYNISYSSSVPKQWTKEYSCWRIGRKFYYDYTTCGFLSIWPESPYGGNVHWRPEILNDIDNLLNIDLSNEWRHSHSPYEVTAKIKGTNIVYFCEDDQSEEEKVLAYLTLAYNIAFGSLSENVVLVENNIQIPPTDIVEIKQLDYWN